MTTNRKRMKTLSLIHPASHLLRRCLPVLFASITLGCWGTAQARIVFSCAEDNDLYKVVSKDYPQVKRYDRPAEAVAAAPNGSGVLVLADGYPEKTTEPHACSRKPNQPQRPAKRTPPTTTPPDNHRETG